MAKVTARIRIGWTRLDLCDCGINHGRKLARPIRRALDSPGKFCVTVHIVTQPAIHRPTPCARKACAA